MGKSSDRTSRMKLRSLFVVSAIAFALLAAGCNLILEPIEQRFLFRPWGGDPMKLASVAARDNGIEEVRLPTADGVTLHGWLKRPKVAPAVGRFPLVIVFGGARRETSWIMDLADKPEHWGWLFINYRGFGLSEGEPSERIVLADTRLIYDYAAARPDVDATNIVVLGRSLGTYFTVALARSRALRGAILATPFDSIAAVGEERYPWLPVGLILNGRYDAAALAPKIKVPALFVLAENDDVTPVENGAALARAWGGPQKILTLAGARHYGIERRPEFWSAVTDFLSAIEPAASRRDDYAGQLGAKP
jgi:pimeloyl-ACP methyl ester carboxylesterase